MQTLNMKVFDLKEYDEFYAYTTSSRYATNTLMKIPTTRIKEFCLMGEGADPPKRKNKILY